MTAEATEPEKLRRVLVVDDSESTRFVLSTWLRKAGFEVTEAATGTEALRIASADAFDIIVLDVNLPDMTGYDVCEHIKSASSAPPVLHVSATSVEPASRSEGLRRGADGYLVEPIEREELLASIEALLRASRAEQTARRLAEQLRRLNDATLSFTTAETMEVLVDRIAREATRLFRADALVAVASPDRHYSALRHPGEDPGSHAGIPLFSLLKMRDASDELSALLDGQEHRGAIVIRRAAEDSDDPIVLSQFARSAAAALTNLRVHDVERRIALTLQESLLPEIDPGIRGVEAAARYSASSDIAQVGGDFYELFSADDGSVTFAIGDVAGHSIDAAAVMAELRTGMRAYLLEGHAPSAVLERTNRLLMRFNTGISATACVGVLNALSGECELANAGHLPPLHLRGGNTAFLPFGGAMLGVKSAPKAAHRFLMEPGDTLVLYTDGLIEKRKESLDEGFERLRAAASGFAASPDELADHLIATVGPREAQDDIALLIIRRKT